MPLAPVAYVPQRVSKRSTVTVDGLGVVENQVIDIEQMINIRHLIYLLEFGTCSSPNWFEHDMLCRFEGNDLRETVSSSLF